LFGSSSAEKFKKLFSTFIHVPGVVSLNEDEVAWLTELARRLHDFWGSTASPDAASDEIAAEEVYEELAELIKAKAGSMNCVVRELPPTFLMKSWTIYYTYTNELFVDLCTYFDEWRTLIEMGASSRCMLVGKKLTITDVKLMAARRARSLSIREIIGSTYLITPVVSYYLYLILFERDIGLGVTNGFASFAGLYKDCVLRGQSFGVGVNFFNGRELRLYKHSPLALEVPNKFFRFEKHQYYLADVSWGPLYYDRSRSRLEFILSRGLGSKYPPFIVWAEFKILPDFKLISIEEPYKQEEPVKPEDAIKAIVSSEQTRSSIEDAVNELTATVQRLKF
jgi:hypothetical protein